MEERREMPNPDEGVIESQVNAILENLPVETAVEVELPSRGRFYGGEGSIVKVKPLTFEDEKALVSIKNTNKTNPVSLILSRCIEGVDTNSLVFMDKMFLIMKIRELSYGEDYDATVVCPKCTSENPLSFNLSDLEVKYIPDEFVEPIEVELPKIKKIAQVRLPRVQDEVYVQDGELMMDNLWRFVVSIDGNISRSVVSKVLRRLPSADVHTIIKAITVADFGIETKAKFKCHNCKEVNLIDIPITENFFSVN